MCEAKGLRYKVEESNAGVIDIYLGGASANPYVGNAAPEYQAQPSNNNTNNNNQDDLIKLVINVLTMCFKKCF